MIILHPYEGGAGGNPGNKEQHDDVQIQQQGAFDPRATSSLCLTAVPDYIVCKQL